MRVGQFGDSWKLRRRPRCSDSKVPKNISKPQPNIHSPCIISDNLTGPKMEAEEKAELLRLKSAKEHLQTAAKYSLSLCYCIISVDLTRTKMENHEDGPGAGRVLLAKAKLNVSKNISHFSQGFNLCYKTFQSCRVDQHDIQVFLDTSEKITPKIHLHL